MDLYLSYSTSVTELDTHLTQSKQNIGEQKQPAFQSPVWVVIEDATLVLPVVTQVSLTAHGNFHKLSFPKQGHDIQG